MEEKNHTLWGWFGPACVPMPLCASRIHFFMTTTIETRISRFFLLEFTKEIAKTAVLCVALSIIWLAVMGLVNWYNPAFHVVATLSSVVMVRTGNSWGILEKLID